VAVRQGAERRDPKVPLPGRYYRYCEDVIEAFERAAGERNNANTDGGA
jgi:hypothetical protein